MIHGQGYTVRAFPRQSNLNPLDSLEPFTELGSAIDAARALCEDRTRRYSRVLVTDPFGTAWAQFSFLWEALERAEKLKEYHHGAV